MHAIMDIGRREQKKQVLHDTMLSVAGELFRERGVAATTIEDIAEGANVSRQTVFNHFPYKEAFALELGVAAIVRVAERAQALVESGTPAAEVVPYVAESVLESAIADHEIAAIVAREWLHTDPERVARAAESVPLAAIFEALLEQAREESSIRDDLPARAVASCLASIVITLVAQVGSQPSERLRRELAISFDMLFNGIT